jgi:4-hydroxy-3-methylbut-2-enyl diphosphate reductase
LTEDLDHFDVVLSEQEVLQLKAYPRYGIASQTTQPVERVRALVGLIRDRFPESEVRFMDTVCQPTKQRQQAAIALAQQCDVVIVIGGAHSNNTQELVNTSALYCDRVHHVQVVADLKKDWFGTSDTIGITAGTSTPDSIIDEVEQQLNEFNAD